jgi:ubiquinone/menaquinone biosynthesis C-methylase UbiE
VNSNQIVYNRHSVAQSWYSEVLQQPEVHLFIKYGAEITGRSVLDIGCGAGRTSFFLARVAGEYVGADFAASMIDVCRARFAGVRFEVCDVRDMIAFSSASFDTVIFSFNGLDCVDHAGRLSGLREVHRVLKPGGLFVFSSHNRRYDAAIRSPKLKWKLNPYRMVRSLVGWWFIDMKNHLANKPKEVTNAEYEIRNDGSHRWQMVHYYIDRAAQERQLEENGFSVLDCVDWNGIPLSVGADDSRSGTLYYAARRLP